MVAEDKGYITAPNSGFNLVLGVRGQYQALERQESGWCNHVVGETGQCGKEDMDSETCET